MIIWEQPGISSDALGGGGGVNRDSSSFRGWGKSVLGDIFLSIKGRIQV